VRTCPNCGHQNADTDNYCANCGTPLAKDDQVTSQQEPSAPSATETADTGAETQTGDASESLRRDETAASSTSGDATPSGPLTSSEPASPSQHTSSGSSLPPPVDLRPSGAGPSVEEEWRMSSLGPPPPRRRTWLWILVGLIGLCLLACVAFAVYIQTDSGAEWWSDIQTEAAEQATERAD
jgi:hypothetical protein